MVEIRGKGKGAVRVFGENGVPLDLFEMEEICLSHDPVERSFSYRHSKEVPGINDHIRNYTGTVKIDELPEGRSAITWSLTVDCDPKQKEELGQFYSDLYGLFINNLKQHLAGETIAAQILQKLENASAA